LCDTVKKRIYQMVGVDRVGMVCQRFSYGNHRVVTANFDFISGCVEELCLWNMGPGKFQHRGRAVCSRYLKSRF
jgi:hypothetical protein